VILITAEKRIVPMDTHMMEQTLIKLHQGRGGTAGYAEE
jgi:hypothetical protein